MTKKQTTLCTVLSGALLMFSCLRIIAQTTYFPAGSFEKDKRADQFVMHWFSQQLYALQEPSLFVERKDKSVESYRFTWLRTFHHPVAIRIDIHPDGSASLSTKTASGAGGYDPGHVIQSDSRILTKEETQKFLEFTEKVEFWSLPAYDDSRDGADGSEWIVEGVSRGNYHVVSRWTPTSGPIYELGRFLLFDLAHLKIPQKEFY
jgi:hypothetical protein